MSTSLDQVDLMINEYYDTMTDPNELAFTNTGKDDESRARTVWLSINANEQNAAEKAVFEAVEKNTGFKLPDCKAAFLIGYEPGSKHGAWWHLDTLGRCVVMHNETALRTMPATPVRYNHPKI